MTQSDQDRSKEWKKSWIQQAIRNPYLKIAPCTVIKLVSGSSDAMQHKVIIWTNADVLSAGPSRRNLYMSSTSVGKFVTASNIENVEICIITQCAGDTVVGI